MGRPVPSDASHCFHTSVLYSLGFSGSSSRTWECRTTAVGVHTKVLIPGQKWSGFVCLLRIPSVHPLSWSPLFSQLPPQPPRSESLGLDLEKALPFKGKERHSLGRGSCVERYRAEQGAQKPWIWSNTGQACCVTLGKPLAISEPSQPIPMSLPPCTPSHSKACCDLLSTPPSPCTHSLPP